MDELIKGNSIMEALLQRAEHPAEYEKVASAFEVFEFADGEPVYEDTDIRDDGLYIIIDGTVQISNRQGKYLYSLRTGDFFGADALFKVGEERGENAKAAGKLLAAALSVEAYTALREEDPHLSVYLSNCLFNKYDGDFKQTETRNAEKERGAKGILFALLLLFFASYYSNMLTVVAGSEGIGLGAIIVYYLGIVGLIALWFIVGKIPKLEMGFGNYLTWNDTVINLGVLVEMVALFFFGAMLADSGIFPELVTLSEVTGTGYFAFIIMTVIYTLIFIICTGFLPTAVRFLLPGKLGRGLSYVVPALFAMVIFGAIGGAVSALWLGITVLSFTAVRIKTGNTGPACVAFVITLLIGTFAFHITYIPLMYAV